MPSGARTVTVEGGSCCDTLALSLALDGATILDAGFTARGCGAASAAGSAVVTLVRSRSVIDAARIGPSEIAEELGGLSPAKFHVAELAADTLGRALGDAVRHGDRVDRVPGRTLMAMSGGVDSAVAALECRRSGEAIAVTLELWSDAEHDPERSCCSASAVSQARALAHGMGLPHLTLDLRPEFRHGVVEPFIDAYLNGETPNPCVGCNGHVRLDALLAFADRLGCERLATGHYARVDPDGDAEVPLIRLAADPAKDQSYMLVALSPTSLSRMRFPLGGLTKPEVRARARAAGLPVAEKADSQDLCFLAGTDRARFLRRHADVTPRPGAVLDESGRRLATHQGQHLFTVGQRRGLGIASEHPLYVADKDAIANTVTVAPRERLVQEQVALRDVTLHRDGGRVRAVKLRYRSTPRAAAVAGDVAAGHHRRLEVQLGDPADAVAPGQLACLLDGELVVGWGTITRS